MKKTKEIKIDEFKELEIRVHIHKNIHVLVEIDYKNGTISLLEKKDVPKRYLFAKRQVTYMSGWRDVLDAMKSAIDSAEKDLKAHQETRNNVVEEFFTNKLIELGKI